MPWLPEASRCLTRALTYRMGPPEDMVSPAFPQASRRFTRALTNRMGPQEDIVVVADADGVVLQSQAPWVVRGPHDHTGAVVSNEVPCESYGTTYES